jgi:hypothetical protein
VVSAGTYILGVALLALLVLSVGFSAIRLRRWLLPEWEGAPVHLIEAILGVALVIWLSELLGVLQLFYAEALVASAVLLAAAVALGPRVLSRGRGTGQGLGFSPQSGGAVREREGGEKEDAAPARHPAPVPPAGEAQRAAGGRPQLMSLVAVAVIGLVFAHYGLTAADALSRGIFNFDSLWYHMPFAVEMAQSHSVTGLHYTETVYVNWAFPQNSELLHAVGILLTERDTLSLFLNFGWLAIAFLAAWCIGRPYGRAPLAVVAAAVILECHTLVVREPGAAKNDLMAAALLLAAIAILINAYLPRVAWGRGAGEARRPLFRPDHDLGRPSDSEAKNPAPPRHPSSTTGPAAEMLPLAMAGLATGLAVGTKSTALAMAAALTVAVIVLAPAGRRWAAAGWWFAAGLAGGGFWYLRNLIVAGNPLPQLESVGPLSLPHPERLQSGRPDFSIVHYATDTAVWRDYFGPGLEHALGTLWPLVVGGAIAGAMVSLLRGNRAIRWTGGVVLFGLLAYAFTPFSAAGAEGDPVGFAINIRYALPALLAGLTLLALVDVPVLRGRYGPLSTGTSGVARWGMLGALLLVLVVTDRSDAVLRDPDRLFAWGVAALFVLLPATLWLAWRRGAPRALVVGGFAALALVVAAIGYPVQRDYLGDRFANADPATAIPGMSLDSAYRWARDVEDARIGLVGTTAGFLQYGFYGTDLSNHVRYIGVEGPHGAFNAIPTCDEFRAAVNDADLDYLVTAPFLNFIQTGEPIYSPESVWLSGAPLKALVRSDQVTVWRVYGRLDPDACAAPRNHPLLNVPQQPAS